MRRTRQWTMNSRTLMNSMYGDDSSLFGIRALEAGYNGGIVQARSIPRQSSLMRLNRLSQTRNQQFSRQPQERPRLLSPAVRVLLHPQSPILPIDLGNMVNMQAMNAENNHINIEQEDARRSSLYAPSEVRAPVLESFAQQLHHLSTDNTEADGLPKETSAPLPGGGASTTRRCPLPRLSSISLDRHRRRLSLPASLLNPRLSRISENSWQRLSDNVNDLDGAAEYGNRYSVVGSSRDQETRTSHRSSLRPRSISSQILLTRQSNRYSDQTHSSFTTYAGHTLSFNGYATPDQTTWDGMSFGALLSPIRLFKRPPQQLSSTLR